MKKILFLIIAVLLNVPNSTCQVQSNVFTPKRSQVTAYITDEDNSNWRSAWDQYYSQVYSSNTMITTYDNYSSSGRFNCHGYAWHMQGSLSIPRWIGYSVTTDEDIYMSDGSYVQVLNEMYPGKVSWGSGDHSAMTTPTSGVFVSKWNRYPLFEHAYNNTPYGSTNLKYYVLNSITGSTSLLCNTSSRVFTAISIPNASYSWNVGSGLSKSENGNSCTVTSNSNYNGYTWIEVTITSPIGGGQNDVKTSNRLSFWIGAPGPVISGPTEGSVGNSYTYYVNADAGMEVYYNVHDWNLSPYYYGNAIYDYDYWASAGFYAQQEGYFQISVTAQNACGTGYGTTYIWINYYQDYSIAPNPASTEITITVTKSSQDLVSSNEIHKVSIYNIYGILLSQHKYSGDSFIVPVSGLKDGSYIVKIDNGKSVVNKQLIIKH